MSACASCCDPDVSAVRSGFAKVANMLPSGAWRRTRGRSQWLRWDVKAPWLNSVGICCRAPTSVRSTGRGCDPAHPRAGPGSAAATAALLPRVVTSEAFGEAFGEGGGVMRRHLSSAGSQCWKTLQKASKNARSADWSPAGGFAGAGVFSYQHTCPDRCKRTLRSVRCLVILEWTLTSV